QADSICLKYRLPYSFGQFLTTEVTKQSKERRETLPCSPLSSVSSVVKKTKLISMYPKSILLLLLLPSPALAQRDAIIPDPDPELERKSFIVDPRFEVNLFAADPLLAKPIQMNWDAAGRLWIASSEVYPQIRPGQKANDKIIILEDTKGVGRA